MYNVYSYENSVFVARLLLAKEKPSLPVTLVDSVEDVLFLTITRVPKYLFAIAKIWWCYFRWMGPVTICVCKEI
jgi:hypothetical protein